MASKGEKNTRYFCNLEKKHYLEKVITKLQTDNNEEIFDPIEIRYEQEKYYKKLYSSSKPILDNVHIHLFSDNDNPFIIKPNEEEIDSCEGPITLQECLTSLKNMKYCKSLGIDGFTVEFYNFFSNDIIFF